MSRSAWVRPIWQGSVLIAACWPVALYGCGGDDDVTSAVPTRPATEAAVEYACPDGTPLFISDSGWTIGTDPELRPEPNTSGAWSLEELQAAAC